MLTHIQAADKFLQKHVERIKDLRNELGGHIKPAAIEFATKNFSNTVGSVTMNKECDGWRLGLECHFAAELVVGAISSKLQNGTDVITELRAALDIIGSGYVHVQAATAALVYAFLWDRFA